VGHRRISQVRERREREESRRERGEERRRVREERRGEKGHWSAKKRLVFFKAAINWLFCLRLVYICHILI
jgi:hypothetical protein